MEIVKSLLFFFIAGLCEIGGGYLIWLSIKEEKPIWYGIIGGIILIAYGIVATFQTANFARTYATYGGVFIVMSLLWAYCFEGFTPDKYDIIGVVIALVGVCIICYAPRG